MASLRRVARGYHGPQYSEDIVHFLRERVCAPAVLFGHSLGGMLRMWVAVASSRTGARADSRRQHDRCPGDLHNPMYTALFSGLRDLARKGGSVEQIAAGYRANRVAGSGDR